MDVLETGQSCGLSYFVEVVVKFIFELGEFVLEHVVALDKAFLGSGDVSFPFDVFVKLSEVLSHMREDTRIIVASLFWLLAFLVLKSEELNQPSACEFVLVFSQHFETVPTLVEMLDELPEFSQSG